MADTHDTRVKRREASSVTSNEALAVGVVACMCNVTLTDLSLDETVGVRHGVRVALLRAGRCERVTSLSDARPRGRSY